MSAVREWLGSCLVEAASVEGEARSPVAVPDCVRADLESSCHYRLPASLGVTAGYGFFSRKEKAGQPALVVMLHGLGHAPCDSQWMWVHAFLRDGIDVLSVALDGHERAQGGCLFDFRQAARTLPLVLRKLSTSARACPNADVYLFGQSMGATYSLLAAGRQEFRELLSGVICVSPTLSHLSPFETAPQLPPLRFPLQLLKDALRLVPYYGVLGFLRLWKGPDLRPLTNRLAFGAPMQAQLRKFLCETIEKGGGLQKVSAPVLWIQTERERGPWVGAVFRMMNQIRAPLIRYSDRRRTRRGVQYSSDWAARAADFILQVEQRTTPEQKAS